MYFSRKSCQKYKIIQVTAYLYWKTLGCQKQIHFTKVNALYACAFICDVLYGLWPGWLWWYGKFG